MSTSTRPPRDDQPEIPPRRWSPVVALLLVVGAVAAGVAVVVFVSRPAAAPPPLAAPETGSIASAAPGTQAPMPSAPAPTVAAPSPAAPDTPAGAAAAVWPALDGAIRYDSAEAAVRGFAVELIGFREPVLGRYQAGDSRSGEIEVRPRANAPATTVAVRRLADDTWWVLGASTADIRLDAPSAGDTVRSPLEVTGAAQAFEGTVIVTLAVDGRDEPLLLGVVTGGGDAMRAFRGTFRFDAPDGAAGALVLATDSAEDGRIWSATVVRVHF